MVGVLRDRDARADGTAGGKRGVGTVPAEEGRGSVRGDRGEADGARGEREEGEAGAMVRAVG